MRLVITLGIALVLTVIATFVVARADPGSASWDEMVEQNLARLKTTEDEMLRQAAQLEETALSDAGYRELNEQCIVLQQAIATAAEQGQMLIRVYDTGRKIANLCGIESSKDLRTQQKLQHTARQHQSQLENDLAAAEEQRRTYITELLGEQVNVYLMLTVYYIQGCIATKGDFVQRRVRMPEPSMPYLHRTGLVEVVPINPFYGFRDIKIHSIPDGFVAGDMFFEVPPLEQWSLGAATATYDTFALGIYGASPSCDLLAKFSGDSWYDSWMSIPAGALASIPLSVQPSASQEQQNAVGMS